MADKLQNWLDSGRYLPEILRDFHDQKDIFKSMHHLYESSENENQFDSAPSWVDGQIYTIDWFLWYMAGRGYTLQKSRQSLEFREFENWRKLLTKGNNQ